MLLVKGHGHYLNNILMYASQYRSFYSIMIYISNIYWVIVLCHHPAKHDISYLTLLEDFRCMTPRQNKKLPWGCWGFPHTIEVKSQKCLIFIFNELLDTTTTAADLHYVDFKSYRPDTPSHAFSTRFMICITAFCLYRLQVCSFSRRLYFRSLLHTIARTPPDSKFPTRDFSNAF